MNKKFYFGLALTAGLFASCSSDDVAVDESRAALNDGDRAAIELLIGNPSSTTRGTGTVGSLGSDAENNKWGGQTFNVYMLDKGELTVAQDADGNEIYNNTVFTAPNELAGVSSGTPAMEVTSSQDGGLVVNSNVSYFPQEGNYDFWAYRTDGAEKFDATTHVPAVSGTSLVLDFKIDGTQDIMTAKAVPNVAKNDDGTYGTKNVPEDRIFSAYSVRREVKPMLNFQHQLARIAFKVKGSKDLCDKSADPTAATPLGGINDLAVKVTAIKLKSLATGKLHVAYTADPTNGVIEFTPGTEAVLPLKQRGVNYTKATVEWFQANKAYGYAFTSSAYVDDATTPDQKVILSAATTVYGSQTVDDKKGLPTGGFRADEAGTGTNPALGSCWVAIVTAPEVPGAISVNADLEDLDPVAPIWNTSTDKAYATPVGEALLVAPQLNYELTVETSQKVPQTTQTYYCTVEQVMGGSAAVYGWVAATAAEYTAAADQQDLTGTVGTDVNAADAIAANAGRVAKLWLADTDGDSNVDDDEVSYKKVAVTTPAVDPDYDYFFKDATDAANALAVYTTWDGVGQPATGAEKDALDAALATGSATNGGAVTKVLTYTTKNDTKTILLNGPSQTVGAETTYKPYKANMSYTITLTLAGMEPVTGATDNIGIGGYQVDEEGSEFDIDMDEATPLP